MDAYSIVPIATRTRIPLEQIDFPESSRPYNGSAIIELKDSIKAIGLQSLPTVVKRGDRYQLVSGRHRIEALRLLDVDPVPVRIIDLNDIEARLWTISENLHRCELTVMQRAEQVTEYARLVQERLSAPKPSADNGALVDAYQKLAAATPEPRNQKPAQVAHVLGGRGHEGGDSLAARDLGIGRDELRRAKAVAALPVEVKDKAIEMGLDDNQAALLEAAKAPTTKDAVDALERRPDRQARPAARPLRNLQCLAAGELARWIKDTTPNDRTHVIRVLRDAATILEDELKAKGGRDEQ